MSGLVFVRFGIEKRICYDPRGFLDVVARGGIFMTSHVGSFFFHAHGAPTRWAGDFRFARVDICMCTVNFAFVDVRKSGLSVDLQPYGKCVVWAACAC